MEQRVIAAIRYMAGDEGLDSARTVVFRSDGFPSADGDSPTVSLGRSGDGCHYPIATLDQHDGHAPSWYSGDSNGEHRNVAHLPAYLERVLTAIVDTGLGQPKSVSLHAVSEDGEVGEESQQDFPDIPTAAQAAASADDHIALILSW